MTGIEVLSRTQKIIVKSDKSVRVVNAGPPGPRGLPGMNGNIPTIHNQTSPSASWIVNHNLGYYPSVDILTDAEQIMFPDVFHSSVNSYSVVFAIPTTGKALSR